MSTVYYDPECFGLKVLYEIEYSSGLWEFDTRVIWLHESGKILTAVDSGCSCPTPFEEYESIEELDEFDEKTIITEIFDKLSDEYSTYSADSASRDRFRVRDISKEHRK